MTWRAVVAAVDVHEGIHSRVSVYLHPLGGRPILWHVVRALLDTEPTPDEVVVVHAAGAAAIDLEAGAPVRYEAAEPGGEARALRAAVGRAGTTLLVDGAAPLLAPHTLARLLRAAEQGLAALHAGGGAGAGFVAAAGDGLALASAEGARGAAAARVTPGEPSELLRVTDRRTLGEAGVFLRDRLVREHERGGVSFLLPATTWLDVDVRIGADTLVYPGCVLEGATEVGAECVIGPHSRLIDSVVGRGVELRGWNYLCRIHVRNRAVLEPFARRGGE